MQVNALTTTVNCLTDPGDYIICEEFTYTHAPGKQAPSAA
jgi:DNA-binding transcriptional MocR family regulator